MSGGYWLIRFAADGFPLITGYDTLIDARVGFISTCQHMSNPEKYPEWKRAVICKMYKQDGKGGVVPIGTYTEIKSYE